MLQKKKKIQKLEKIYSRYKNKKNQGSLSNSAYFGENECDLSLNEEGLFLNNLNDTNLLESNLNETLGSTNIQLKIDKNIKSKRINKESKANEIKNFNDNFIYYGSKKYESKTRRKIINNENNTGDINKDEQFVNLDQLEQNNEHRFNEINPKFTNAYLKNNIEEQMDLEIKKKPEFLEKIESISSLKTGIQSNNLYDSKQYFLKNR